MGCISGPVGSSPVVDHAQGCPKRMTSCRAGCTPISASLQARRQHVPVEQRPNCRQLPGQHRRHCIAAHGQPTDEQQQQQPEAALEAAADAVTRAVGEDAALFRLQDQSVSAWGIFTVLLTVVLATLYAVRPARPKDGWCQTIEMPSNSCACAHLPT